jgi:hypothetical protein
MRGGQGELNTLNTFSAKVADDSGEIKIQESEILEGKWYGQEEALAVCTNSSAKSAISAFYRHEGVPVQHKFPEDTVKMSWQVAGVVDRQGGAEDINQASVASQQLSPS